VINLDERPENSDWIKRVTRTRKFDPTQRRDSHGRWTEQATVTVGDRPITVVKPARAVAAGDKLVPINVIAFDTEFQREEGFYLGVGGEGGIGNRYDRFGDFIASHDSIEAPEVSVNEAGRVGFTNGRHRYAWLRDQGLTEIPLSMSPESVRNAKRHGMLAAVKRAWDESEHPRDTHGRFSDVPAEPGTTPIPPGKIRGYHYTGDMDAVEQEGLNVSKAQGEGYGEPNAIWFSTAKPSNHKEYVEVFLDSSDIAMGAGPLRAREDPTSPEALAKIEDYNKGDHDFMVYSKGIPPDRFVSTHRPWHDHYRYFEENPETAKAVLAGEFDDLLDDPDHGPAIRKFKETHTQKFDPNEPRDEKGKWTKDGGTSFQQQRLERLKKILPLAETPRQTSFLLPDGTRLRAVDQAGQHANHETAIGRYGFTLAGLQNIGVARYVPYVGVEIGQPLTRVQAQMIADDWIEYETSVVVEGVDPLSEGRELFISKEFHEPSASLLYEFSKHAFQKAQKSEHSYGNTQIHIDPASSAAASLNAARATIADADCMADGKDVDPNHVTVRYGLENEDLDGLRAYLSTLAPFEARVLRVELFPASEHSDGAMPVVALIASPELRQIEQEIGKHADFKEKSFPVYKPHCTLAYCKPEKAEPYADLYVDGSFVVSAITISHADHRQEIVHFGTQKFDPAQRRNAKGRWVDEGEDPPAVGPRIGFVAGDGKEHVGRKTGGLGNYAEDHTNTARRLLNDDQALNAIRTMLEQGAIRYWVRRGEVALNFKAGNTKTITHALKFLHDNYQHGDRIYLDVEHGDTTVGKFFDNLGEANRAIRQHGLVQKKDPVSGRYVTPFVSFDKQGDESLRMIASLNSSRLATWGFTAEAEVLGMARYRLTAILDGRTSKFCRLINGKVFNVPDARRKVIEVLEVQDPNDLRVVQPWPKQTKAALAEFAQMSAEELTARGLHIPPYHPHCRTILRAIQSSTGESTEITPTVPAEAEAFHAVTADDLKELGIEATPEQVDQWNEHVGMTPVELLSKFSGLPPQEVMTKGQGVGANPIRFEESGNIGFNVRGSSPQGIEFKLGALLDPFTGTYYLTRADLEAGNPKGELAFMKQMFSALIDMGLKSTATEVAVGVAGNAAYYARLGFLPDELEWDSLRTHALTIAEPMLASLQPQDRLLVEHLLQDRSVNALSALVELPFTYEGVTIGEWLFGDAVGTWGLDLTDDLLVAQAKGYLA